MTVTSLNFEKILELSWEKPVLVDFWAPWCGPCRMLSAVIEQLEREMGAQSVIGKVNVDEEAELAMRFGVTSIPTIIVFKNGKVHSRVVGYRSLAQLKGMLA
ncbi:MAG: thioredoxin [Clostridiales bacterium]|jgi:thioredoxin 1|nr:thioredoxin [Clostridiales bacterium]